QVPGVPAHQLHRPDREEVGSDDHPHQRLGEVGGLTGGLDDRRHAGEQRRGQLLEHPPAGEVEGVDVERNPRRGVATCTPANDPSLDSRSAAPSTTCPASGSSRRPLPAYASSTPMPPSMSMAESARVAPVAADSAYSSSFRS